MLGLDTNVLIRYVTQDDKTQSALATKTLEKRCTEHNPGFINHIVLCELVWVLESAYGYSTQQISDLLESMIQVQQFTIQVPSLVWQALRAYRNGSDFSDYLIAAINKEQGCDLTVTFDKAAGKMREFECLL